MADSVARVKILAQIEGLEGFDKLKGAFKGLQQAIGPTDQQLAKARQDVIAFGEAGKKTEQIIRGQIDALKALKAQTSAGGGLYSSLGNDIRRLESDLNDLSASYTNAITGVKTSLAQARNLANATKSPGLFGFQISDERKRLQDLKLLERDYLETLARIRRDETTFAQNQGRSSVISEAMARNPAMADVIRQRGERGTLPNTLAAKQNEIAELKDEINNILRGTQDLEGIVQQWRSLEQRLARQLANPNIPANLRMDPIAAQRNIAELQSEYSLRKEQMLDLETQLRTRLSTAEKEYQHLLEGTTQETVDLVRNMELRERVQQKLAQQAEQGATQLEWRQSMRREDGVMIAGGKSYSATAPLPDDGWFRNRMREISPLYQSIGSIGLSPITNDIERMGKSYQKVAKDIRAAKAFSDGSINSLQSQRASWQSLRNSVDASGKEFKEATRELAALDKQLERTQPGGLRGKVGYIAQGIGAAASAGIFGGPEGAIGGLAGGALGAVLGGGPEGFAAGSFIGSSVGAYVGMGRQAFGGMSTYAADIQKQEIALKGVTKTQAEYQRALAASASVTRDFNVPQLEATRGMTQLSAAVIGAGGKVADAEVVFRNVTAAIKASGGSAEDVQGALTALGQIFSKGKVSAEELQGQLGERLPGAVTMFAKATGRTLPQLQKDLEQGVIGLNDLMKFVTSDAGLGQFEQKAKDIAQSSAEAGARLTTTWNNARRAIGEALLPLGADLQDAFSGFLEKTIPYFVLGTKAVVAAARAMFDGISAGIKIIPTLIDVLGAATKALIVFGGVQAGVFVASNIGTFASAIGKLIGVFRQLLSIQKALMAIESARAALLVLIEGLSAGATKGKVIGAVLGGAAGVAAVFGIGALVKKITDDITKSVSGALNDFKLPNVGTGLTDFTNPTVKTDLDRKALDKVENDLFQKQLGLIEAKINLLREQGRVEEANSISEFDKASDAIELAKSEIALKRQQLDLQQKFGKVEPGTLDLQRKALDAQEKLAKASFDNATKALNEQLDSIDAKFFGAGGTLAADELNPFLQRIKDIREEIDEALKSASKLGGPKGKALATRLNNVTGANIEGIAARPIIKGLQDQIFQLQNVGTEMSTLEKTQQELGQGWVDMNEPLQRQIELLARQVDLLKEASKYRQDMRIGEGFKEGAQQYVQSIGTMREATAELAQTGIKGVEEALFNLATTGTANFREFAADMLKQTARMIIQQLVLRTLLQAIGAIGGGGSGAGGTLANFNAASAAYVNANGNVFANGIKPFAAGGIVTRPTLFKFANGGSLSTGLMGEAGPEAIVPLKRGADGKLGIAGGGGSTSVTVNVDASGSQVQGDSGKGEELGRAISTAVQAELIKQKRPGGLLAA